MPDINASNLIKVILKSFNINQAQLAGILNVLPWSVTAWLNNERVPSLKHINKLVHLTTIKDLKSVPSAMAEYESLRIKKTLKDVL